MLISPGRWFDAFYYYS